MSRHSLAVLALLATAGAWGATFTLVKHILQKIEPEPFIFLRFMLAGLVLLAVAAVRPGLSRDLLRPGITLGALVFSGYWLQTHGLLFISPSRSALLTGLYVVIVPFCERALYRNRVPLTAWIGSVLALVGTTLLIGGFDGPPTRGDVFTLLCAIIFALHVVLSARYTQRRSAAGLAAVQVFFVGVAAGPPSLFVAKPALTTDVVVVIVFTAIVTTALAFTALMWGQARVSSTEAAIVLAFEPVAAAITSILWDEEPITIGFIAGGITILAAMIVSQLPQRRSATMPQEWRESSSPMTTASTARGSASSQMPSGRSPT